MSALVPWCLMIAHLLHACCLCERNPATHPSLPSANVCRVGPAFEAGAVGGVIIQSNPLPDMNGWSRVLLSHTVDGARSY